VLQEHDFATGSEISEQYAAQILQKIFWCFPASEINPDNLA
jgi:hypothetical protein